MGLIGPKGWEVETPEEIEEKIAKSGFSIHYNPDKGKPEFTKPPQLSEGHVTLASIAAESIKIISNVNTGMLAQTTKLSGIALEISRQQGIMGSEVMFDNFDRTQKIYGDTIREIIQRTNLISDQEIMSIIEDGKIKDAAELKEFRSIRKGRFGIKISQSENTPTRRIANYELLKSAVKEGMPISPVFLFEASDLPNKDDIVADLKKKEQAAQAQAQEQATLAKAQIELEQAKLKADVEKARALAVKAQAEAVKAQAETARLLKEGAPKPQ